MKKIIISGILISAAIFCGCDNDKKTYSSSSSSEKTSSSDGFSRRRYRAQVLTSQNNLKQIGNALQMYTECSKGMLLPHGETRSGNIDTAPEYAFEVLRSQGHLTDHKVFAAPYGKTKVGKGNEKLTGKNCSYVYIYVSPNYSSMSAVAFEKPWHLPEQADSISVLYADGHTRSYKIKNVSKMSCRKLILNHPEIFGLYYKPGDPLPTDYFDARRNELD